MPLDPRNHADWEIAEASLENMKTARQLADDLGIENDELLPYGHHMAKVDYAKVLDRLKDKPDGKFIEVTAINPTPFGEGKSTTALGLLHFSLEELSNVNELTISAGVRSS